MWITRSACPLWSQSWSGETDRASVHMADLVRFVVSLAPGDAEVAPNSGGSSKRKLPNA
jgi:hypothetical protein